MRERKRILIIDDSESNRRRLEACLSHEYDVRSVSTAPEADSVSGRFRPHMVVEPVSAPGQEVCGADGVTEPTGLAGMVGACPAMLEAFSLMRKAAESDAGVVVVGECGTGKQLAARAIHDLGPRRDGAFVTLNAEAFEPERLEAELLGRVNGPAGALRGALEQADGGTLLLGGLESTTAEFQERLLAYLRGGVFQRVRGEGSVSSDARVIVAADHGLGSDVARGDVRSDLYYTLCVLTIVLPPLREREGDVMRIARRLLRQCVGEDGNRIGGFTKAAVAAMLSHDWPGNIVEMENRVRRAVIVARGRLVTEFDLGLEPGSGRPRTSLREALDELAREMVGGALRRALGNVSEAARSIGVSRTAMYDMIHKYEIDVSEFKKDGARDPGSDSSAGASAGADGL